MENKVKTAVDAWRAWRAVTSTANRCEKVLNKRVEVLNTQELEEYLNSIQELERIGSEGVLLRKTFSK